MWLCPFLMSPKESQYDLDMTIISTASQLPAYLRADLLNELSGFPLYSGIQPS